MDLSNPQKELLKELALDYIWWKHPLNAIRYPFKIITQVMNIGDIDAVKKLLNAFDEEVLIKAVKGSEIGEFSEISWNYWHLALGISNLDNIPPMPLRKIQDDNIPTRS